MEKLLEDCKRLKAYFPFRIIWGYIGDDGAPCCFASTTRRALLKEVRAGRKVYTL